MKLGPGRGIAIARSPPGPTCPSVGGGSGNFCYSWMCSLLIVSSFSLRIATPNWARHRLGSNTISSRAARPNST